MNENFNGENVDLQMTIVAQLHVFGVFRTFAYFNFMGRAIATLWDWL